jgi:hypothetical protein
MGMQIAEQTDEQWIAEAEARLQKRYDCIRCAGRPDLKPTFIIKPKQDAQEAEYFV